MHVCPSLENFLIKMDDRALLWRFFLFAFRSSSQKDKGIILQQEFCSPFGSNFLHFFSVILITLISDANCWCECFGKRCVRVSVQSNNYFDCWCTESAGRHQVSCVCQMFIINFDGGQHNSWWWLLLAFVFFKGKVALYVAA